MFVAVAMSIVACGPSAEEKAKMEADAQALADSLLKAASQAMEEAAPVVEDSTAAAATTEAAPATETK